MTRESGIERDDRITDATLCSDSESVHGHFIYNSVGNFTFVDEKFAALFRYTKAELLAMNFVELVHSDDIEKVLKLYEIFVKTGHTPSNFTLKCVRKDKSILYIELSNEVIKEGDEVKGTKGFATLIKSDKSQKESAVSENALEELKEKINQLDSGNKRTFTTIRHIIVICLSRGQLSINEIAHFAGINWKTVENHLTYLIGKKLVRENFSSKYVRLFELTKLGEEYVMNLREDISNYFLQKSSNQFEVKRF